MKEVHMILQGKGGVGKSLIASLFAQFLLSKKEKVHCFDTDPLNQTFSRYTGLHTQPIDILTSQKNIDTSKFDVLMEKIIGSAEGVAVIDNGAATFVPLMAYLKENNAISFLKENKISSYIHVPIVGAQAYQDTISNLSDVLEMLDNVIIWANHYWGAVEKEKPIQEWNIIKKHKNKILGVIHLKQYNPATFGKDVSTMTTDAMTFDEIMRSNNLGIMTKQRLKTFQKDIFGQLDKLYNEFTHT